MQEILIISVTKLCNRCYRDAFFHISRKQLLPCPKKAEVIRNDMNNYRPILLMPVWSMILEKCIAVSISEHLEKTNY